jgi:hypothetical protein
MADAPAVFTALYRPCSIARVEPTTSVMPTHHDGGSGR